MSTIGGDSWDTAGTLTAGVAPETDHALFDMGPGSPYFSAWWTFEVAEESLVTIDTYASTTISEDPDTKLYVYSGADEGSKVEVAYNDDEGDAYLSRVQFVAAAATVYHVQCGTYGSDGSEVDGYILTTSVISLAPPVNDDLAARIPLSLCSPTTVVLASATLEGTDETDLFDTWSDKSAWYEFTPAHDGLYGFDGFWAGDDGQAYAWFCEGSTFGDLTIIDTPTSGGTKTYEFTGGTTYVIRIASDTGYDTISVEFTLREYKWGEWQDNTTDTVTGGRFRIDSKTGSGGGESASGAGSSDADRGTWFNAHIATEYADAQAAYNGTEDAFFVPPDGGASLSLVTGIFNEATARGKVVGAGSPSRELDFSQTGEVMTFRTGSVPTFTDTETTQYEEPTGMPIAAHIVVEWSTTKSVDSWIWSGFDGTFGINAYYPSLSSDAKKLRPDYQSQTVYGPSAVANGASGSVTLDLDASAFADSADGYEHGVMLYGTLNTDQPTAQSSISGSNSSDRYARLRGETTVNTSTSTFTFQRPRYRVIELVPCTTARRATPPRRLWPRTDHRAIGIGRGYPAPDTQQAGHRFGSGAPL